MLGAIVGDIVGSVYEWNNIKTKDFPLFRDDCFFTDDTVMTCAVAEAIMNGGEKDDFIDAIFLHGIDKVILLPAIHDSLSYSTGHNRIIREEAFIPEQREVL